MIAEVKASFDELDPKTLSNVWYYYQYVMQEVIKVKGEGNYMLPHHKKKQLEAAGNLPLQIQPDKAVVHSALAYLHPELENEI